MGVLQDILKIIAGAVGGGGVVTLAIFLINRHDAKKGKYKALEDKVDGFENHLIRIEKKMDAQNATNARIRILQFSDEIRHEVLNRSKESYDQVLLDIDEYEKYCKDEPTYKNSKAVAAISFIRNAYDQHLKDDSFLK